MPGPKHLFTMAIVAVVVIALVFRISAIKSAVTGS